MALIHHIAAHAKVSHSMTIIISSVTVTVAAHTSPRINVFQVFVGRTPGRDQAGQKGDHAISAANMKPNLENMSANPGKPDIRRLSHESHKGQV
jgi:hypothetical protein